MLQITPESIARAVEVLQNGGVVAFPTETVYGLGALAFDRVAVARIFDIKQRPSFDPLIVHVLDRAMLAGVASEFSSTAEALAQRFWPGPLTLVLPKTPAVPGLVTAGLPSVAVRMPSHPVARALLHGVGAPIAAPSANRFGTLSPTRAEHVARSLEASVAVILDGGPSLLGIESTIVGLTPAPMLLRPGAIPVESIEAVIGPLERSRSGGRPSAPGQLARHYAPRTPLRLVDPGSVPLSERRNAGALLLAGEVEGYQALRVLSRRGDLCEAAAGFFEALHALDSLRLQRIDAQSMPAQGLGLAMMDRLPRAALNR
ncbi:MAG: threonylcarbamoyl-AMP synthase [Candidatus Eremiobacteraeota bacterium]|nr:threonylcarbamoyl-AMP synthase [Candidatus Eremiobacteraeota bacterium]